MAGHNLDPELVELIVREVVRRLLGPDSDRGAPSSGKGGELQLDQRLVTLDTLAGRLDGVRRVVVPARAVVTPSARDQLKDLQIELTRQ